MRIPWWPVTALVIVLLPWPALAQRTASSFDQLAVLVEPGDRITVRDAAGAETTGRLDTISPHGLTILANGKRIDWTDTDVTRISQRRQDSLANGALWGLVGGAGTFVTLAVLFCAEDDCDFDPAVVGAVAVYAGLGAAVGVGVDALITRRQVIYERAAGSSALSVAPILSHGRRGVALSLRF